MPPAEPEARFPLGLLLAAAAIAVYKSVTLSVEMGGSLAMASRLFALDLGFLALLGLIAVAACRLPGAWLRRTAGALLVFAVAFYLLHTLVLLALDEPMSLHDLARYLPEAGEIGSFVDARMLGIVAAFLLVAWVNVRLGRRALFRAAAASLLALAAGLLIETRGFELPAKYQVMRFGDYALTLSARPGAIRYTRAEAEFYADAHPPPAEFLQPEPDIVLLIVESLSSINSRRVSGVNDLLGGFDRLADRGVLFPNFFANHQASEGGIISLLSGFPPLHYPTATPLMFDEFATQPSVVSEYGRKGYFTEFLTNADLGFIGLDRYIGGLGLHKARGRDEIPAMRDAPRFAQDAPSDRLLYEESARRVAELAKDKRPWLLVIATVSTHLPYRHPEGGDDDAESVWRWAQERMLEFVDSLEAQEFFENGILLITGDHRQMRPLTVAETERYGDSAKARVPLLAIGAGLPHGRTDQRFFQQSDLLRLLPRIRETDRLLSPHPVWVERYNRIYGKVDSINRFSVFDQADDGRDEFPVRVSGARLEWPEGKPGFARSVEALVHRQRSSHQFNRNGDGEGCRENGTGWAFAPTDRQGLRFETIPGDDLNGFAQGAAAREVDSLSRGGETDDPPLALLYRAYLRVERPGVYWFRTRPALRACLSIANLLVLDQSKAGNGVQGPVELAPGLHPMEFRVAPGWSEDRPSLQWVTPGLTRWHWREVPDTHFRLPRTVDPEGGLATAAPSRKRAEK